MRRLIAKRLVSSIVISCLGLPALATPTALRPPEPYTRAAPRDPEPAPGARQARAAEDGPLFIDHSARTEICHVQDVDALRRRLLGLHNTSEAMSLEVWGDEQSYGPFQKVLFQMRVPRAAYVTLYWLGPEGHVTVAIDNVHLPAERDVVIDSGGIIVPPFGREQWVAIATLEPFPLGCTSEARLLAGIESRLAAVHGVGRWEVRSGSRRHGPAHP
jgi:hypothetical protein